MRQATRNSTACGSKLESLEARLMLAFGDRGTTTNELPLVTWDPIAIPMTQTGRIRVSMANDSNAGDRSTYDVHTYRFGLPSNAASTANFIFSASNPVKDATDYVLEVYADNGDGVLDRFADTQLGGMPPQVFAGTTRASGLRGVTPGGTYFLWMYANGDRSGVENGGANVDATIDFTFRLEATPPPPPIATLDSAGNLTVNGTSAADVIDVSISGTNVIAKRGSASLAFSAAAVKKVIVNAGDGNDSVNLRNITVKSDVRGGNGNDNLIGGAGDDSFDGGTGADVIDGGTGGANDDVHYFTRKINEPLVVTLDNQANDGGAPDGSSDNVRDNVEVVHGGAGHDHLTGSGGNNALAGNGGNDTLVGGAGNDVLLGGDGNDVMDGGTGADLFDGDAGNDTADYSSRRGRKDYLKISLNLSGGGSERVGDDGGAPDGPKGARDNVRDDVETVIGGAASDIITGSPFSNRLIGGKGDDQLLGGHGNDTLEGGKGNDLLRGGKANDNLNGGGGVDQYFGDAGDDVLFSRDAAVETLEGGSGTDTGTVDKTDRRPKNDLERLLA